MAIYDEIREQQKKLKEMTPKEKWQYFWYYYRIHTIAAVFIIICLTVFIRDMVTAKDYAFYSILLNSYAYDASSEEIGVDFGTYAEVDLNEYECYIDTSSSLNPDSMTQMDMAVTQKIMAMTQAKTIDVIVSDDAPFENYAQTMMFTDLRTLLSAEELAKYEDKLYYVDGASQDAMMSAEEDADMTEAEAAALKEALPVIDHSAPDKMKDPIPVGIYVGDAPKLKEWGAYQNGGNAIFGVVASSQFMETGKVFLNYLYQG